MSWLENDTSKMGFLGMVYVASFVNKEHLLKIITHFKCFPYFGLERYDDQDSGFYHYILNHI